MPARRAHQVPATTFMSPVVVPEISIIVDAKTPIGFDLAAFVVAAQSFVDDHLGPVWGVAARLRVRRKTRPGCWALVLVDTEPEAQDDGWHEWTDEGMPLAKVFLGVIDSDVALTQLRARAKAFRDEVTLTITHEIAEMLVDPAVTLCVQRTGFGIYSLEVADPVEDEGFRIDGFKMTDFVYPSWYEQFHLPGSTTFDHCDCCTRPFHILPNGYASILRRGRWHDRFGSAATRRRFLREDREGHRTERRRARGRD